MTIPAQSAQQDLQPPRLKIKDQRLKAADRRSHPLFSRSRGSLAPRPAVKTLSQRAYCTSSKRTKKKGPNLLPGDWRLAQTPAFGPKSSKFRETGPQWLESGPLLCPVDPPVPSQRFLSTPWTPTATIIESGKINSSHHKSRQKAQT